MKTDKSCQKTVIARSDIYPVATGILAIAIVLSLLVVSACAKADQIGRITGKVNFREAPNRSARVLEVLAPDTDVQIVKRISGGWYLVNHRGQQGFVHESYIKKSRNFIVPMWFGEIRRQYVVAPGMIIFLIIVMFILHSYAPFVFKPAALLIGCFIAVLLLDYGFRLNALYSFFLVSLGLLLAMLVWVKKTRT
jgi:hypothetical protein